MKKGFAALVIMFFASSFVLAQDAGKSAHPADNPHKRAAEDPQRSNARQNTEHPPAKKGSESKHQPKTPCSHEEQEFDKVLRSIYG
jgi:hypothetical protein